MNMKDIKIKVKPLRGMSSSFVSATNNLSEGREMAVCTSDLTHHCEV